MCPEDYFTRLRRTKEECRPMMRQEMVLYAQKHGISEAARQYGTTRKTVRMWVRRWEGRESLVDRSKRPKRIPCQTAPGIEESVAEQRRKTGYGPHRLADWLERHLGLEVSPWTIRNILKRKGLMVKKARRKTCYPAHWAWETGKPFRLLQVDVKDVHDKAALGTERTTHLVRAGLPRYQWTAMDGASRVRFLAYSHSLTIDHGIAFMVLVVDWIRSYIDLDWEIEIQTDWGVEFGGDNPDAIERLNRKYLQVRGARLCRYPKGRKGYNGRVERLHRTDDEEFYKPLLLASRNTEEYLDNAFQWQVFYDLYRPHYGVGMNGLTPMEKLRELGVDVPDEFVLFPPVELDRIATAIVLQAGYDVPAKYSREYGVQACCRTMSAG